MAERIKAAVSKTEVGNTTRGSNPFSSAKGSLMNELTTDLRTKRCPGGKPLELASPCAVVAERSRHLTLNQDYEGSTPSGCTMNRYTSTAGLVCVVRPAAPCARQHISPRGRSSEVEHRPYTPAVTGSIPVVRTDRMSCAEGEPRQSGHAGVVQRSEQRFHTPRVAGSNPASGTRLRRRTHCVPSSRRSSVDRAFSS